MQGKKPINCLFRHAKEKRERPKTLSVSGSSLFCSKEFFNLEVPTCLLACTLRLLHTFPSLESYSWINDVSSFLKRGLFDAFFSQKKALIDGNIFPALSKLWLYDFSSPNLHFMLCVTQQSWAVHQCSMERIRVMSLARGLANYWSPMLLYHQ